MAEGAPVLDIRGLTVRLPAGADRANAIEDVSLTVRQGEIVCIVGESGSGKSVTAFTVMGLLPRKILVPTAGAILLDGEDVLRASSARLRDLRGTRMAMIFQEPMTALNPVLTIGDQVDEVLRIHTRLNERERKAKVIEIMGAMRLPEPERLYGAYPHQISGGQRQRIMIAAALVLDPSLLIADEPTTALDVTTQAQILALIKDLQRRRGTGVLFITHDFGVVAEIADRVVVMQHGRVVEEGPTEEVLRRPQAPYTRMLIAAVPSLEPKPRPVQTGALAVETVGLTKVYGGGGFLRKEAHRPRRRQRQPAGPARRDAGHRRRIRLRQDHRRALHRAAGATLERRDPAAGFGRHRDARRTPAAPAAPAHPGGVPGPLPVAEPAPHRRRVDRRRADEFRPLRGQGARARAVADAPRRTFARTRSIATRTSSPAASASASPSPARSPWSPRC